MQFRIEVKSQAGQILKYITNYYKKQKRSTY